MADDEAKKKEASAEAEVAEESPKKKKSVATMGIFGAVMLAEGLAIFFAMRFFGSAPDPAKALEPISATTQPFSERREIEVARVRVQNTNGERSILYSVTINIVVDYTQEKMIVEEFLENRKATITDTISRIIRSSEAKHLSEPGLETLKRQISFELGVLLKDDTIIEQVLIPEFTPLPTGF